MVKNLFIFLSALLMLLSVTGCMDNNQNTAGNHQNVPTGKQSISVKPMNATEKWQPIESQDSGGAVKDGGIQVVADPESIPVLVNKQNKLPDHYQPDDLVTLTMPFIHGATPESRKMRMEAAAAMEKMYAAAKQQGIYLLGVSAYRSHASQTNVFNSYVKNDGYNKALTYSALPGTSEHETGLAIDVTGGNGKCAAEDCFGGTKEAGWLQEHAADFGFIIRYPKGKESITGYQYEPWHIRYVGKTIAEEIMGRGITLEEYYENKYNSRSG